MPATMPCPIEFDDRGSTFEERLVSVFSRGAGVIVTRLLEGITKTAGREAAVAGVLAFALFVAGTGSTPILGRDEARFSQAAREMLDRGDVVVPTFAGQGRYHKPILIYWCTMASYGVFGVTERAARLPSNLAGAVAVIVLAAFARRRFGAGAGLLAGALLAVTPVVWLQAKACTADMVLLLPTLVMMLAFERLLTGDGGRASAFAFWAAMGVAILAKGPIAPAWVLCTSVALWAIDRRWRSWELTLAALLLALGWWRLGPAVLVVPLVVGGWQLVRSPEGRTALARMRPGWGVPLLLIITLPWAVAATVATDGAFLREAIGEHVVGRSFQPFESHGFFVGFYLVTAVVAAFPWLGLMLGTLSSAGRSWQDERRFRYLVAWFVSPLVLLELVQTKLVHYWMPSYPAGVLLAVGGLWALRSQRRVGWGGRAVVVLGALAISTALVAVPYLIPLVSLVRPAVVIAIALAGAAAAGAVVLGRRPVDGAGVVVVGAVIALAGLSVAFLPELGRHSLGPAAARRAVELAAPDEDIVVFKPRDEEIYFYLPIAAGTCGTAGCMAERFDAGASMLGVARLDDFDRLVEEWRGVRLIVVDRVAGVEAGRARWSEQVLFRVEPASRKTGVGVDRRRAPS
jgi:4-amino-4-deoxy-L-arabinose transferase-like glycosyltransferase